MATSTPPPAAREHHVSVRQEMRCLGRRYRAELSHSLRLCVRGWGEGGKRTTSRQRERDTNDIKGAIYVNITVKISLRCMVLSYGRFSSKERANHKRNNLHLANHNSLYN